MWFNIPLFSRRKFDQNAIFNQGNLYHTYTSRLDVYLDLCRELKKSGVYCRPARSSSGGTCHFKKIKVGRSRPQSDALCKR